MSATGKPIHMNHYLSHCGVVRECHEAQSHVGPVHGHVHISRDSYYNAHSSCVYSLHILYVCTHCVVFSVQELVQTTKLYTCGINLCILLCIFLMCYTTHIMHTYVQHKHTHNTVGPILTFN